MLGTVMLAGRTAALVVVDAGRLEEVATVVVDDVLGVVVGATAVDVVRAVNGTGASSPPHA